MIITDFNSTKFRIDGVILPKVYKSRAFGSENVLIHNVHNHFEYAEPLPYYDIEIDGVTYGTQAETINEINKISYASGGSTGLISGRVDTYAELPAPAADYQGQYWLVEQPSGGALSWMGIYKYPRGIYSPNSSDVWELVPINVKTSEDSLTLVNISNWIEFYNYAFDINAGDRLIYNNSVYQNLTGTMTNTPPSSDLTNWINTELLKLQTSTGIIYGGELSINSIDDSTFDIEAGQAVFVDSYTNPQSPTFKIITWVKQEGVIVDNLGTSILTYVRVDINGTFKQYTTRQNTEDSRDEVQLGLLVHDNFANLSNVSSLSQWNQDTNLRALDSTYAIGRINMNYGNKYYSEGGLNISKTAGRMYADNSGYGTNKKDPNFINSDAESNLQFFAAYDDGGTVLINTTDVDTNNYNPGGVGGLVAMPADSVTTHGIFFSPDTGITVVHYGQYLYDSLREAVDAWEKEDYNVVPELDGVPLAGVLAFKQGATDLTDPLQAKFIKPGAFGFIDRASVPNYSRYAGFGRVLSGLTYQRPDVTLIEDTGEIYAEVERAGGGDIVVVFGETEYILNCTTGPGTGGKARIQLTQGTDTNPQFNWVYMIKSGDEAVLNSSITRPTGEFAYLLDCFVQSAATFAIHGALAIRRWTDAKEFDGRGTPARTNERLRVDNAKWENGTEGTIKIINAGADFYFECTSGQVWQKHLQNFPALDSEIGDLIFIPNDFVDPYKDVTNLNGETDDANGDSLDNTSFSFVFWGVQNKSLAECKLHMNKPIGSYAYTAVPGDIKAQEAHNDAQGYSVYDIPKEYEGKGFLIGRATISYKAGLWTFLDYQDLRGFVPNTTAGSGSGGSGVSTFTALTDTPSSYTGEAGKVATVNSAESALIFEHALPRLTLTERNAIASPEIGDAIFNTTDEAINIYTSNGWLQTTPTLMNRGVTLCPNNTNTTVHTETFDPDFYYWMEVGGYDYSGAATGTDVAARTAFNNGPNADQLRAGWKLVRGSTSIEFRITQANDEATDYSIAWAVFKRRRN